MKNNKHNRMRVLADIRLQGFLCLRITIYWVICQATVIGTIFGFVNLEGIAHVPDGSFWRFVVPALFISSFVLPIALFDMLVFSNRFAGPILNFRRRFNLLANDKEVDEMRFRPGDYYCDLSDNFNKIRVKVQSKKQHSSDTGAEFQQQQEPAVVSQSAV